MNIQELEDKHSSIILSTTLPPFARKSKLHGKLSVEFAIEILDSIFTNGFGMPDNHSSKEDWKEEYETARFELKQYLDE